MSNAVRNQQKLMDVRHFGAVGDGVADDTAAGTVTQITQIAIP